MLQRGGRNEKEEIASLVIAFGRLNLRRMRNGSRYGGRHTESRESCEKGSLRITMTCEKMTLEDVRKEIQEWMDELTRRFAATHDPELREELYKLTKQLEELDKMEKG